MKNKITSLILATVLILSLVPMSAFAEDEPTFAQGFNSCATNETPSSLEIKGKCSGAYEYEKGNKGLLFDDLKGRRELKFGVPADTGKTNRFYFSFDIMTDGITSGDVNLVSGSSNVRVITFKNNVIQTHNRRYIAGLGKNVKKTVTVEFDAKHKECNIYINKKLEMGGYYHSGLKEGMTVTGFSITFNGVEGGSVLIDNLIAGAGKFNFSVIRKLNSEPLNEKVVEVEEYEKLVTLSDFGYREKMILKKGQLYV